MSQTTGYYGVLKGRVYHMTTVVSGRTNEETQTAGRRDVFDLIMSSSDNHRQSAFLSLLKTELPLESDRKVLLDGMAREYAGAESWMAYVERETGDD